MRLLIADPEHARYADLLGDAEPSLQLHGSDDPAELARLAARCPVWLGAPDLLAPLLRGGARPQWVQSTWAGITPMLAADLPRDYRLSRAVGVFGQAMAEYVLTYLLAHERQVLSRAALQGEGRWDTRTPHGLGGRRALIVGAGDIGHAVARLLAPFGIELRGIARQPRALEPFLEVAGIDQLQRLAAQADYLINLLPNTPDTGDLYDAGLFARLPRGALFINAGRGTAVVDADLVAALQGGQLAAAVIDVCREEPPAPDHPFWRAPNLLLTGHTAAPTPPRAMARLFLDNLTRHRAAEPLLGQVDFARGY